MWSKWFNLVFFYALGVAAQSAPVGGISFQPADTVRGAYIAHQDQQYIFIASEFGKDRITQGAKLDSVSGFLIKEIVLVYSRYHRSENFNQNKLNEARWGNLQKDYPLLFQHAATRYRNLCQDVSGSDTSAKKLTHGFYIYFENRVDPVKRATEISEISKMAKALGIDTSEVAEVESASSVKMETVITDPELKKKHGRFKKAMRTSDPKACRQPFYKNGLADLDTFFKENLVLSNNQKRHPKDLMVEVYLRLDFNGFIKSANILAVNKAIIDQVRKALSKMDVWNPAVMNGVTINSDVKFVLQYQEDGTMGLKGGITVHKNLQKCGTAPDKELFDFTKKEEKDRLLPTVFEVTDNSIFRDVVTRNTVDSLLIVLDLTGSMGPYIAQVLDLMAELILNDKPHVSCISLFNDGDAKADKNKQVGSTGGIIVLNEDITLDKLARAILKSMKRGTGGDIMENNIEAVLKGVQKCSDCRDILMVADNFATPRDGSLVGSITKPIHWLLCGVNGEINVHYLDLVRANKGYLHTFKSDVSHLHLLKEGQTIIIDEIGYRLIRGKFKVI